MSSSPSSILYEYYFALNPTNSSITLPPTSSLNIPRFDTRDYPPNHPSGIPSGFNKKVLGMFKDEVGGKVIEEFVGLRAKLYSYEMLDGEEHKKCKRVKKSVIKKRLRTTTENEYDKSQA